MRLYILKQIGDKYVLEKFYLVETNTACYMIGSPAKWLTLALEIISGTVLKWLTTYFCLKTHLCCNNEFPKLTHFDCFINLYIRDLF